MEEIKVEMKDFALKEVVFFEQDDIRRLVSIMFLKNGGARCVFLNRIIPIKEKMSVILPQSAMQDVHCQLFYVDKRAGYVIAEFIGMIDRVEIRNVIRELAETASGIGGGFFPGYKNIADVATVVVGYDANNIVKIRRRMGIKDARITDSGKLVFISSETEEIKMMPLFDVMESRGALVEGKTIFKAMDSETIFALDRVKGNKIKAITNVMVYDIALDSIMPRIEEKKPLSQWLPKNILSYNESDGFAAIASGNEELTLMPA